MAPNPRRQYERIQAVYAKLPKIQCQGKCQKACGPIQMSQLERRKMEAEHGEVKATPPSLVCSMLGPTGQCIAYDLRPMICRMWGVVAGMPCPHGCMPEGGHMPDKEGFALLSEILDIGGRPLSGEMDFLTSEVVEEVFKTPGIADFIKEYVTTTGREYRS